MQRTLDPTPVDTTKAPAFIARASELESPYQSAQLLLVSNSQKSEHHLQAERRASKASDSDNSNALVTIHFPRLQYDCEGDQEEPDPMACWTIDPEDKLAQRL
jgi:hypothetical protein